MLPRGYWNTRQNQKIFLDALALKLNVKQPSDWGKIKTIEILRNGGAALLKKYGTSVYSVVKGVYTGMKFYVVSKSQDIHWKQDWFQNMKIAYKRESQMVPNKNRWEVLTT